MAVTKPFLIGGFMYQDDSLSYVYYSDFLSVVKFFIGILLFLKFLRKIF